MSKRLASLEERRLHAEFADALEAAIAHPERCIGIDLFGAVVAALRRFADTGTLAPPPRHKNHGRDNFVLAIYDNRRNEKITHAAAVAELAEQEGVAERTIERTLARAIAKLQKTKEGVRWSRSSSKERRNGKR